MDKFNTPEEYFASLFLGARDRFRAVEAIQSHYIGCRQKIASLLQEANGSFDGSGIRQAEAKVRETLAFEDFDALVVEHAKAAGRNDAFRWLFQTLAGPEPAGATATERTLERFPAAHATIAETFDFMAATVGKEIDRVRPQEIERLNLGVPWLARVLGQGLHKRDMTDQEPEPVERQSLVLRALIEYRERLERAAVPAREKRSLGAISFEAFNEVLNVLDSAK